MTFAVTLLWWLSLLNDYSKDLTVIWNDRLEGPAILGPACAPLEGIQNVLQPVVDVMEAQRLIVHVQSDLNL